MAAIDSLLKLISAQKAEALVINTNKAPALINAGVPRLLSMPPLNAAMIDTFLHEVLAPAQLEHLETTGSVESMYRSDRNGTFAVKVRVSGQKLVVTFRPSRAGEAPHPEFSPGDHADLDDAEPVRRPHESRTSPAREPEPASLEAREDHTGEHRSSQARDPHLPHRLPLRSAEPRAIEPSQSMASLFDHALSASASDLVLSAGATPAMRTGGDWQELHGASTSEDEILALLEPSLTHERLRLFEETGSVDLTYVLPLEEGRHQRFRVNLFREFAGLSAAFRPIREEIPTLPQLGLPDVLRNLIEYPHGLVLITGPTGSGKSTTLAALIEILNRTRSKHILTLEDPIEYLYRRKRSIIHQREVGTHVESFSSGLRAALREAPDVILVGEMRDRDTIAAAITAAETGHLVLSTLHSGSASMAIDRMIDVFPEYQQMQIRSQLAAVLRSVVTQRLLPGVQAGQRVAALEILHVNYAVASLIRERKAYQIPSQMQLGREEGMVPLEQSLTELVRTGRISRETAARATSDNTQLREWMREKG